MEKFKEFIKKIKDKIDNLDKSKKIAISIGIVTIIASIVFSISYMEKNKFGVLYSGLDTTDAANITKELDSLGVETKIEGDIIYVPKEQVDRLRLELSSSITNGSKGFELMDESSSLSMTDEEFQIKKLRMLQGELEKTIKTFPQVDDTRVHITQGEQSVFSRESTEGKAAVYVSLKVGQGLEKEQIKSIMSLVSASTTNIPKQNIEVIDQNMNLLSEGIYDENGNIINNNELYSSRDEEKQFSSELQESILSMLEGILGKGKVKVTVNADLNFDTIEKTELKIDPETVIKSESRSESATNNQTAQGSPVDNNMTNTAGEDEENSNSKEESIEYEIGKTETKTIIKPGEVSQITAAVAIDGDVSDDVIYNVEKLVSSALGINTDRGDQLTVVSMNFNNNTDDMFAEEDNSTGVDMKSFKNYLISAGIISVLAIFGIIILIIRKKKSKELEEFEEISQIGEESAEDLISKIVKEKEAKLEEITKEETELSLEEEIRYIVSKNTDEASDLIKSWLND